MTAPATITSAPPQRTSPLRLSQVISFGLLAGVTMAFIAAIGMLETFNGRHVINPYLSLGYLFMLAAPLGAGYLIVRRRAEEEGWFSGPGLLAAIGVGVAAGIVPAALALVTDALLPGIRDIFPNLSPAMIGLVTFERGLSGGLAILIGLAAAVALLGGVVAGLPERLRKAVVAGAGTIVSLAIFEAVINDLFRWFRTLPDFLYASRGGLTLVSSIVVFVVVAGLSLAPNIRMTAVRRRLTDPDPSKRARSSILAAAVIGVLLVVLPQLLGGILNELLTNVGLFLLMALGLNIVVGLAGLLDLGYVAFFAVGAYTMAILTSPISPRWDPMLTWWEAFPFVIIAAAIAGILVGTPVIRMRGDYLAIVTLGFGEIVRLVLLSDWLAPFFGGAQGIRNVPGIPIFGVEVNATSPDLVVYVVIFFVLLASYITWRVQDSRLGRAWAAIREDEDVAEAIGVDTVKAKLLAFVTGATLAGFAGAIFAAKVGSVFTNSFEIIVSIVILVIVIVGGMGNIAGVAVGAFVLIGVLGGPQQPGLLQEFGEFKLLIYGALLVFMMLERPEGLIPSTRRAQELHQEEFLQDAWLDKGSEVPGDEEEEVEMSS